MCWLTSAFNTSEQKNLTHSWSLTTRFDASCLKPQDLVLTLVTGYQRGQWEHVHNRGQTTTATNWQNCGKIPQKKFNLLFPHTPTQGKRHEKSTRTHFHKHSFKFFLIPYKGADFGTRENSAMLLLFSLRDGNCVWSSTAITSLTYFRFLLSFVWERAPINQQIRARCVFLRSECTEDL